MVHVTRRMTSSILKEEPLSETFISSPATWQDHDNLTPPKNLHTYSLILLLLLLLLLFIPKNIIIIINIIIFSRTLRFFFISPTCEKKKNRETWHVATPYWISWRSKRGTYRTWLSEAKKVLDIRWPCGVRVRGEYTRWVDLVSVKYENVAPWETDTSSFAE